MYDLKDIKNPGFLATLSIKELETLCQEIREFLIDNVAKTGGHLAPNLGAVEITVALHRVFSSPHDKLIFDVGHQAYTHKILTGRASQFPTLRKYQGLSGFLKRKESPHDIWEAGHSSTSISAATGLAYARDYLNEKYHIVALIGDGSLTSGMAYEALNHLGQSGKKVIVILNDNKMSISQNVGAINTMLNKMRLSRRYNKAKNIYLKVIGKEKHIFNLAKRVRDGVKSFFLQNNIFEEMGFEYYGPIDGHDLPTLINVFNKVKIIDKPVLIHLLTKKGKGYPFAENDNEGIWHGVGPFDKETGKPTTPAKVNVKSWSAIIAEAVTRLAAMDERIVAITPAMKTGSSLQVFEQAFPDRFIDVGIAEEHAITFAGGMALNKMKPFVSVYSTFLQRAYDQINHDLARQNLPVVVGVDRAGLVDGDGETHQGIFDIAFVRHIPNTVIMMPQSPKEAYDLLYTAFKSDKLVFIRYPRGNASIKGLDDYEFKEVEIGSWTYERHGNDFAFITYGPGVDYIKKVCDEYKVDADIINARFIKPLDDKLLKEIMTSGKDIIVFEEVIKTGSLNSAVLEFAQENGLSALKVHSFAIDDTFVGQGEREKLYNDLKLDVQSIVNFLKELKDESNEERTD